MTIEELNKKAFTMPHDAEGFKKVSAELLKECGNYVLSVINPVSYRLEPYMIFTLSTIADLISTKNPKAKQLSDMFKEAYECTGICLPACKKDQGGD